MQTIRHHLLIFLVHFLSLNFFAVLPLSFYLVPNCVGRVENFYINPHSGLISLAEYLDYEDTANHTLVIKATDGAGNVVCSNMVYGNVFCCDVVMW